MRMLPALPALLALLAIACLAACSQGADPARDPHGAFLAGIEGTWVGVLKETGALEERVVREMPMRLTIDADGESTVEYPMLRCRGVLRTPPEGIPLPAGAVARFQLEVDPPGISPCMSGLVRITRKGEALEYAFLGDSLRRIRAALLPQP